MGLEKDMMKPDKVQTDKNQDRGDDKNIFLRPDERIDDLQIQGFRIIQNPEKFCFGMDAVLLSDYAGIKRQQSDGSVQRHRNCSDSSGSKV